MSADNAFRWLVLLIFLVFGSIAVRYRVRSYTGENLDRWQEGAMILFGLRLSAIPVFLSILAFLIRPTWMSWSSASIPIGLRCVGVALAAVAGLLIAWTFRHLGANLTDTVVTRREHHLVTSGPYRYVRHPFYMAGAIGLLGVSLAMANWFVLLAGLVPAAFLVARTPIEESKLAARFGAEYRDYQRRVGRFFPRWQR